MRSKGLSWMRRNSPAQFLDGWSPGYSVHRVYTEASARGTVRLPAIMKLTLEPESLKNQLATTRHQTKDHQRSTSGLHKMHSPLLLKQELFRYALARFQRGCGG
jgi:hypothetical protein